MKDSAHRSRGIYRAELLLAASKRLSGTITSGTTRKRVHHKRPIMQTCSASGTSSSLATMKAKCFSTPIGAALKLHVTRVLLMYPTARFLKVVLAEHPVGVRSGISLTSTRFALCISLCRRDAKAKANGFLQKARPRPRLLSWKESALIIDRSRTSLVRWRSRIPESAAVA